VDLREINFLIAKEVLGWELEVVEIPTTYSFYEHKVWCKNGKRIMSVHDFNPLVKIEDAWLVIKKIKESRFSVRNRFVAELQKEVTPEETKNRGNLIDTGWMIFFLTPKAICLAALRTYGIDINDMMDTSDQSWFWTEEWQKEEREVENQIKNGNVTKPMSIEEVLKHLDYLKGKE
jgi:hypothetical protein